ADGRSPPREVVDPLARSLGAERAYWARLEVPFVEFFVALPNDRSVDPDGIEEYGVTALPRWGDSLRRAARDAFESATRALDASGRNLKAVAKSERAFYWRLNE